MSLSAERSLMGKNHKDSLGEITISNIQVVFITQLYHHILYVLLSVP